MEKKLRSNSPSSPFAPLFAKIDELIRKEEVPKKYGKILKAFILSYETALLHPQDILHCQTLFADLIELVRQQCIEPFLFPPYHKRILSPFNYYQFGIDLLKPLVDLPRSQVLGLEFLPSIIEGIKEGRNAIFLANHQTEADPHAISILLEKIAPQFAEEMIFVAGERVITDPLAIPFSMGRNLLCIYSKRYIDNPPEQKLKKQLHNKRTMELMSELLSEGGKAIYVAPSGGRDRPNQNGIVEVSPYDPQSIEMLYLMAQRAKHPTDFFPMALKTYALVPPPETIQTELGELRLAKRADIHLSFGKKIDMEHYPGSHALDKHSRRLARAEYICQLVRQDYAKF